MEDFDCNDEIEEDTCTILKSMRRKTNIRFRTRDKKRCESNHWQTYFVESGRYVKFSSHAYNQFCKKRSNRIVRKFNGDISMCGMGYKKLYDLQSNANARVVR